MTLTQWKYDAQRYYPSRGHAPSGVAHVAVVAHTHTRRRGAWHASDDLYLARRGRVSLARLGPAGTNLSRLDSGDGEAYINRQKSGRGDDDGRDASFSLAFCLVAAGRRGGSRIPPGGAEADAGLVVCRWGKCISTRKLATLKDNYLWARPVKAETSLNFSLLAPALLRFAPNRALGR